MAQIQVIAATTDAASGTFDASRYSSIVVSVSGLSGAEEVSISVISGGTSVPANDETGTVRKLTASIRQLRLEGGLLYSFGKSATASARSVFVNPGSAKRR